MAFAPYKTRLARAAAAAYAGETLAAYLQGQERPYAVQDALNELRALFHEGAQLPCELIQQAMMCPDEDHRFRLVEKAMEMIERQVRGDSVAE